MKGLVQYLLFTIEIIKENNMNKYKESLEHIVGFIPTLTSPRNGKKFLFESINLIQELVDKETLKKIIKNNELEDCDRYMIVSECWNCPSCKNRLFTGDNYCRKCGQALDWSENNE